MMESSDTRPLALITGASAGIGAEYARRLAAAGYDLALTARRRERLEALAGELESSRGVDCLVIAADLANPRAPAAICRSVEESGRNVDLLVNNAGYGVPGYYNSSPWEAQRDFLQVMVTAVAELSYRLLPAMRARGSGGIINVASLAGIVPGSGGHTLYAGVKAFMIKFSEALAMENADAGVCVQALCPGFTYSEFHDVIGTRDIVSRLPDYMWMNAGDVVRISLEKFRDLRAPVVVVPGRVNRFIAMLSRKLPYRTTYRMMAKRAADFRRQG